MFLTFQRNADICGGHHSMSPLLRRDSADTLHTARLTQFRSVYGAERVSGRLRLAPVGYRPPGDTLIGCGSIPGRTASPSRPQGPGVWVAAAALPSQGGRGSAHGSCWYDATFRQCSGPDRERKQETGPGRDGAGLGEVRLVDELGH